MNLRDNLDISKLDSGEYEEAAAAITPEDIVTAMFDRNIFWYKVGDPMVFMLLPDETSELIQEFAEADYRHTE